MEVGEERESIYLFLHCHHQNDLIFQTFDEQFVAVDDVRPTVSDGLYSKCTPPPPPLPSE